MTWDEARRISLLKERPEDYPLKVTDVQEIGILDSSINVLTESIVDTQQPTLPSEEFAAKINAKLAISQVKDVFIYLHGYKVVFENPLLVASELWHFLGYEGAFIAFSWPSTPSTLAYFSDLETAALSAGNLRIFVQYLAEKTEARRIHIIGYSAGTRVVAQALNQLVLMYAGPNGSDSTKKLRIGHVMLTGSDLDLHLFGSYLVDGVLDVVDTLTVYASAKDKALGISKWVWGLEQANGGPIWTFRSDYIERLREALVNFRSDS
jgi:esterase/lipase superfamily enzyme